MGQSIMNATEKAKTEAVAAIDKLEAELKKEFLTAVRDILQYSEHYTRDSEGDILINRYATDILDSRFGIEL